MAQITKFGIMWVHVEDGGKTAVEAAWEMVTRGMGSMKVAKEFESEVEAIAWAETEGYQQPVRTYRPVRPAGFFTYRIAEDVVA